jgi:hypothetical protein
MKSGVWRRIPAQSAGAAWPRVPAFTPSMRRSAQAPSTKRASFAATKEKLSSLRAESSASMAPLRS